MGNVKQAKQLAALVRAGLGAIGLNGATVVADRGAVVIPKTGVEIWWVADEAAGAAAGVPASSPGWVIRESCFVRDLLSGDEKMVTDAVARFARDDIYAAARTALLLVAQRRLESAFDEVLSG